MIYMKNSKKSSKFQTYIDEIEKKAAGIEPSTKLNLRNGHFGGKISNFSNSTITGKTNEWNNAKNRIKNKFNNVIQNQ